MRIVWTPLNLSRRFLFVTRQARPSPTPFAAPRHYSTTMPHKRSPTDKSEPKSRDPRKRRRARSPEDPLTAPHPAADLAEESGIVLRKYYPPEMSNYRASAYTFGELSRPMEDLDDAIRETQGRRDAVAPGRAVVHWFKGDLRTQDNRALYLAGKKAAAARIPLVCLYIVSPQDFEAHLTSPARVDFIFRTLEVLRADLAALDVPLHVETVERRARVPERIAELLKGWGAKHLFANMEYEVDELRRETDLVRLLDGEGVAFTLEHDTCVVAPGSLESGAGKQYAVYSPWFKKWVAHVHANHELLDTLDPPQRNPTSARNIFADVFDTPLPPQPESKRLADADARRFAELWPAGEGAAMERLQAFCDEDLEDYAEERNTPARAATSRISAYLAVGAISSRTCVSTARDRNTTRKLDQGAAGARKWIAEVAWREFYKHILVNWPYICMNKPFKIEFSNVEWVYNKDHFAAWCEGRTGYPIVDAAMRQLHHMGWMHNRCRMIVACFLAKDLLLDWRMGERYFMEHLIDGDFASNNGGWGFSASVGADPQPYFRIFNPLLQSEKFDPDGAYIREWVPELADVPAGDPAIHDPYARGWGERARKAGYPKPIVQHKESRERALRAFKAAMNSD